MSTLVDATKSVEQLYALRGQILASTTGPLAAANRLASLVAEVTEFQSSMRALMEPQLASIRAFQTQVAESLAPYQEYSQWIRAVVEQAIQPVALASVTEFASRARAMKDEALDCDAALAAMGWRCPRSTPFRSFMTIGALAVEGKKVAVRREMTKLVRGLEAKRLAESWMDADSFRARRRFILDGVFHSRRRYGSSGGALSSQHPNVAASDRRYCDRGVQAEEPRHKSQEGARDREDPSGRRPGRCSHRRYRDVPLRRYGLLENSGNQPTAEPPFRAPRPIDRLRNGVQLSPGAVPPRSATRPRPRQA